MTSTTYALRESSPSAHRSVSDEVFDGTTRVGALRELLRKADLPPAKWWWRFVPRQKEQPC